MSKVLVQKFCGEYPSEYIKPDIKSNPNFVFENDINFETVQLWDIDGNTVFVNSFIECEHYVIGGWSYLINSMKINESTFQLYLGMFVLFGIFFRASIKYFLKIKNG